MVPIPLPEDDYFIYLFENSIKRIWLERGACSWDSYPMLLMEFGQFLVVSRPKVKAIPK